ncbi:MAG: succinate dehydrogenase cytochrome b subunit [Pseudomonadota bacterium]
MQKFLYFISSPIGGKIVMALSGAMMIIFLLGHALGNLLIFSSQNALNSYAHWLQHSPFLWVFRISMLLLLSLHIFLAVQLYLQNRIARPVSYYINKDIQLSFSAKTMVLSGFFTLLFVFFHIAHLTLGWVPTTSFELLDNNQMIDVYNNVVRGFKQPLISLFYLFSIFIISLHLRHAIKSIFQTLGFHHENFHRFLDYLSPALILALMLAFMSIPLSVMSGFL